MHLEEANELILAEGYETGIEHLPDVDQIRVGARAHLRGVSGAMVEWWFGHLDEELYLRWNPASHRAFAWVEGWEPGRYVGATHLTQQELEDGRVKGVYVTFVPRALWLDWRLFEEHGVSGAVCGFVRPLDAEGKPRDRIAARLIIVCLDREDGCELRSSMWFDAGGGRYTEEQAKAYVRHIEAENEGLAALLPQLYAARAGS